MMNWFGGGWFMMLFWWIVIIAVVIMIVNYVNRSKYHPGTGDTALEILKKRYARGEINQEEFDKMKKEILNS
ncbi:MAG: SHOCT domain-containing protein [Candidatus Marinimicrobia bacterium]|nr:SHOCT domain-containing protein [Candidatus Neomarinimicrobiota bacterium]